MHTAENYRLVVSPLTGTVFITKISKKDPNCMTDDRRVVPKSEFLAAIINYTETQTDSTKQNIMSITCNGEVIAEVKLFPKKIPKAVPKKAAKPKTAADVAKKLAMGK